MVEHRSVAAVARVRSPSGTQMKSLLYISIALSAIVVLVELSYLNRSSLALVLIALAVAVGLQAVYLIKK